MAIAIPAYLLGKDTTWNITGIEFNADGTINSGASVTYTLYARITSGSREFNPTIENNSPMHLHNANHMLVESNESVTIEELMQSAVFQGGTGTPVANVLETLQRNFLYAKVAREAVGTLYEFLGLIGNYSDQVGKHNVKAKMTLMQIATIDGSTGAEDSYPKFSDVS